MRKTDTNEWTNGLHAASANRVEQSDGSRRQPSEPTQQAFRGLNSVAEQAVEGISALMERKPWLVVGGAAIVGLVAGLVLKRNR